MRAFFCILLLLFGYAPLVTAEGEKPNLLIMDVQTVELLDNESRIFTRLLVSAFLRTEQYRIIPLAKRDNLLEETGFSDLECNREDCWLESARLLRADWLVTGELRYAVKYKLVLKLIETATGNEYNALTVEYKDFDALYNDAYALAGQLAGVQTGNHVPGKKQKKKFGFLKYDHSSLQLGQNLTCLLAEYTSEPEQIGMHATININYNLAFPWGSLGFGFLSAFTISFHRMGEGEDSFGVSLLSWPQAVNFRCLKNFVYPFYGVVELNAGFAVYRYSFSNDKYANMPVNLPLTIEDNERTQVGPFGSLQLGMGVYFLPWVGFTFCGSLQTMLFDKGPWWMTTVGCRFNFNH